MAVIPDVNVDNLRPDFKNRIDVDKTAPRCIWCKTGSNNNNSRRRHQLLDCPNAFPLPELRSAFSNEVFGAGHGDAAVAYIHQLQREHNARQDGLTPFNSGRLRYQISNIQDVPRSSTVASASTAPPGPTVATAAPRVAAVSTPPVNALVATASAPSADTTTTLSGSQITSSTVATPTANANANAVPPTSAAVSTAPASMADLTRSSVSSKTSGTSPYQSQQGGPVDTANTLPHSMTTLTLGDTNSRNRRNVRSVLLGDSASVSMHVPLTAFQNVKTTNYAPGSQYRPDEDVISQKLSKLPTSLSHPIRQPAKEKSTAFRTDKKHQVITNHFEVNVDPQVKFYEYRIVGIPVTERRAGKKRYMETIIKEVPVLFENRASFANDSIDTIIAWKDLHSLTNEQPIAPNEWPLIDIEDMDIIVPVNLRYIGQVDIAGLQEYTSSNSNDPIAARIEPARNALNILFTKCIHDPERIFHLNAHKFFVKGAYLDLRGGRDEVCPIRAVRGFSYTIKPGMGKILLNVTPVTSVFWNNFSVSAVLKSGLATFSDDRNVLKGVQVRIDYDRKKSVDSRIDHDHSRIKKIRGFGMPAKHQTFEIAVEDNRGNKTTRTWTVEQYLRSTYQLDLNGDLPAVNLGTDDRPSWFPADWLTIVPCQIWARIVPDAVAEIFHRFSCQGPVESRALIERLGLDARWLARAAATSSSAPNGNSLVSLAGCPALRLNTAMMQIPAARLPLPRVEYRDNMTGTWAVHSGRWNLANNLKFLQGSNRTVKWKLLVAPGVSPDAVTHFTEHFNNQLEVTGVCVQNGASHLDKPLFLHQGTTEKHLRNALEVIHANSAVSPDIVVLLLAKKDQGIYSNFKYLADNIYCMQAICATEAKFKPSSRPRDVTKGFANSRSMQQYMANVAMKANLKVGGVNHTAAGIPNILDTTMLLGADLTHAGSGAVDNCPSIAAVVGSMEKNAGRFRGVLSLQPKSDMVLRFEDAVVNLLEAWFKEHDRFPKNIVYYRDGVSSGQYAELEQVELSRFPEAFGKVAQLVGRPRPQIKVTTIIVTKRHSTRFYPARPQDAMTGNNNCHPGTLVDSAVTSPYFSDFYLQTQNAIKGTARPCHYYVLRNEIGVSVEKLQDFTHQLCHTYVRATLGVSYAPPAYYADRLCERGRCYLREWYSPDRATKDTWGRKKSMHKKAVAAERELKSQGRPERKQGTKKTEAEIEAEDHDFADANERMYKEVFDACQKRLDAQCRPGAEKRREKILETMYWM